MQSSIKSSPPTNQHTQFFYRPDALPVAQPTVSKLGRENITFHGLAYPKLTWGLPTLSLTTNSSWLPWGRVAMPLISPLDASYSTSHVDILQTLKQSTISHPLKNVLTILTNLLKSPFPSNFIVMYFICFVKFPKLIMNSRSNTERVDTVT